MDFTTLYNDQDKAILKTAEDTLDPHNDRVQEIIEYAQAASIQIIGIAHCTVFNREAENLREILEQRGFRVAQVNCKYGRVPFHDLVPGYQGTSCNPAGQAKFLAENKTELNIMMGLCLGHDMIFNAKSTAPVTPLIVKDRKLKHNTLIFFRETGSCRY